MKTKDWWARAWKFVALFLMCAAVQAGPAPAGVEVRELRGGLYWVSDGAYNTMFLVSSKGVIAIDPLPTLGTRYLEAIRSVTDRPVTHVVYSHAHIDHIGGASLFPAGAAIVAQRETARVLRRRADPRRPAPTVVFDRSYTLKVGDQTLQLSYKGTNHSEGNLFIYAPRQKVLMLVDVVYPGYMPYPELGVASDIDGYVQAHRDALAYDFIDFVGGHVDRLGTRADVQTSLDFVLELRDAAQRSTDALGFPAFLKLRSDGTTPTWFLHDDYEKDRVEACFRRLIDRWAPRLQGADRFLRSHCWRMIVGQAIDLTPQ
jgi:glyoxylase-like metal-dependent hydrolase (beta-lactamase superfamily II)